MFCEAKPTSSILYPLSSILYLMHPHFSINHIGSNRTGLFKNLPENLGIYCHPHHYLSSLLLAFYYNIKEQR
jgi:hypothetical protein